MDRLTEINVKHDRVRALLAAHNARALWLRHTRNIAWFTAGADASIVADNEAGVYSVLVTPEKRIIIINNIEVTRARAEDKFEALGFEYAVSPWYAPETPAEAEGALTDDASGVGGQLQALRSVLMESEQIRLRALGHDAAASVEEAVRAARPGDTEFQIASRLDAACRARGGLAVVNLIATDERIYNFRHPLATDKPLQRYLMVVVCMRRGGLVAAVTRLGYFGALPDELREKNRRVAHIDGAIMAATLPGRTMGEMFSAIQAAYAAQGEADQWQNHHQGGLIGYAPRERIIVPGDALRIEAGNAFGWNPSIVGCKSEDTFILGANGHEIVTPTGSGWPVVEVEIDGMRMAKAGILEL